MKDSRADESTVTDPRAAVVAAKKTSPQTIGHVGIDPGHTRVFAQVPCRSNYSPSARVPSRADWGGSPRVDRKTVMITGSRLYLRISFVMFPSVRCCLAAAVLLTMGGSSAASQLAARLRAQKTANVPICIVGAGPGGLQVAHSLSLAGREFLVFERTHTPGAYFTLYPRHRKLISLNKRFTGRTNPEFNLRHDWQVVRSLSPSMHSDSFLRAVRDVARSCKILRPATHLSIPLPLPRLI